MAEIRKHRPGTAGSIGDQVRANIDSGPRPVTPGESSDDPFFAEQPIEASPSVAGFNFTTVQTDGWFALPADALDAMRGSSETSQDPELN